MTLSPLRAQLSVLIVLSLSGSACSSSAGDADAAGVVATESFVVDYETNPSPPRVGENSLDLRIEDKAGDSVTGAEITVVAWMAGHGHGSESTPETKDLGQGRYRISDLVFQMPGDWSLDIQIDVGAESESLSIEFGVE